VSEQRPDPEEIRRAVCERLAAAVVDGRPLFVALCDLLAERRIIVRHTGFECWIVEHYPEWSEYPVRHLFRSAEDAYTYAGELLTTERV
jgi:hypothetical protein